MVDSKLIPAEDRVENQTSMEENNDDEDEKSSFDKNDEEKSPSSSSESENDSENSDEEGDYYSGYSSPDEHDDSPETNFRRFSEAIDSRSNRKQEELEEKEYRTPEELFDFPRDPENWTEEDLRELWADAPRGTGKTGWDPAFADNADWAAVNRAIKEGKDPIIAPFYVPYRKPFPAIPDNHHDISNPKSVIEELDRIEEFLSWVSYVFADGSTYEGTVWDDCAHGKGVYVTKQGLVRYEGEWVRNEMEGHGVVEVDIPDVQPVPGSALEAKMRKEGKIITRDFMEPEDRKWLEMDIEDTLDLIGDNREIPFFENDEWVKLYGEKPEKGRYRYAGQWKHSRMHGCGVFEVNERILYGRFYFGKHLEDSSGCEVDISGLHAGIADVAAAKARMFINKPDGMVREKHGPYNDPQHPYFYEGEDVWMAPGFINQFHEVPDVWKTYVEELDQEREMWLNSFYKAPLRLPMPAELEYWWDKDPDNPEFIAVNDKPGGEAGLLLHTPTGRLINHVDDEEHGIRLFWQPDLKEGEEIDLSKVEFLPLGFDDFYGISPPDKKKQTRLEKLIISVKNALKSFSERLDKWAEEKKKASEMSRKLLECQLEYIEAEICLEEATEELEMALKMKQRDEEKKAAAADEKGEFREPGKDEGDEGGDEDDEDESGPMSFGSVENGQERSSFSSLTMSFGSLGWPLTFPCKTKEAATVWQAPKPAEALDFSSVKMPLKSRPQLILRAAYEESGGHRISNSNYRSSRRSLARLFSPRLVHKGLDGSKCRCDIDDVLSLPVPLPAAAAAALKISVI